MARGIFKRLERIRATSAQLRYLRVLNNQCFAARVEGYYIRDWDRILRKEASSMIETLKERLQVAKDAAKARGETLILPTY